VLVKAIFVITVFFFFFMYSLPFWGPIFEKSYDELNKKLMKKSDLRKI